MTFAKVDDPPLPFDEPDLYPCAAETRRATFYDPPEFCENDAEPGSEFCASHDPDAFEEPDRD